MSILRFSLLYSLMLMLAACGNVCKSNPEAWQIEREENGGFEKEPFPDQECPPNMALIEGGFWYEQDDSLYSAQEVKHFFISEHEETNGEYLAYLNFLKKFYSKNTYTAALPDTAAWLKEPNLDHHQQNTFMNYYLRHPAYKNFPVVGLNEDQINRYAIWKTDRLNEYILIREKVISTSEEATDSNNVFTTKAYLASIYHPSENEKEQQLIDLSPKKRYRGCRLDLGARIIRMEDGILVLNFRLLSKQEAHWAMVCQSESKQKNITHPKEIKIKKKYCSATSFYESVPFKHPAAEDLQATDDFMSVFYQSNKGITNLSDNVIELIVDTVITEVDSHSPHDEQQLLNCFSVESPSFKIVNVKSFNVSSPITLKGFRLGMDYLGTQFRD